MQFSGGDTMCEYQKIPVSSLAPNQTTQVLIHLVSPKFPGVYKSEWRMVTQSGTYFGGKYLNVCDSYVCYISLVYRFFMGSY